MNVVIKRDRRLVSIEKEELICRLYQNNELIHDIANKAQCERHSVVRVLKRHGIYQESKSKKHLNNDKMIRNQKIFELAKQGLTNKQIAAQLNIGKSTVQKILQDNPQFVQNKNHHYLFNENYFEEIQTEGQAYWLGFLYADGCIADKSVRLELALTDRLHVEKFRDAIQYQRAKIYYRSDNIQSACLVINSQKMVNDLIALGCMPKKSLKIRFPHNDIIPDCLIHHFMRGYFDGNGSVCTSKDGCFRFSVVSNVQFLEEYQKRLNKGIHKNTTVKICNTHSIGIGTLPLGGSQQVLQIFHFLYSDATIFLQRKYDKFLMLERRLQLKAQKKAEENNSGIKQENPEKGQLEPKTLKD